MELGKFFMSLTVKDIEKSYEFYKKLGFEIAPDGGSIEEKWLILQNESSKIGLYEGILQKNTLTFLSPNARELFRNIQDEIEINIANGMEVNFGPCYFMIRDPDGNPILFDQQND